MAVPTDEQIEKWRKRWEKYPGLDESIANILRGFDINGKEIKHHIDRTNQVLELLRKVAAPDFKFDWKDENEISWTILDLRGINWGHQEKNFRKISLYNVRFDGAILSEVDFTGATMNWIHLERADLHRANLTETELSYSYLMGTNLFGSILNGANLSGTDLSGANLVGTVLLSTSFYGANIYQAKFRNVWLGKSEELQRKTWFANNIYLDKYFDLLKKRKWKSIKKLLFSRWFYTDFSGVFRVEETDTTLASDLRRYVEDQRFVSRIKDTSPFAYHFWNITTACGWSTIRLLFWAIVVIFIFAGLYSLPWSIPDWWSDILNSNPVTRLFFTNQSLLMADSPKPEGVPNLLHWFYISFDIFSNLGIRVATKPATWLGVIVVFLETILGWITLGLSITVFANKYARRS